jgi:endoglucanase
MQMEDKMNKVILGIFCAVSLGLAAPINDIGSLSVVGNQIVGANGQPAQLMGMSFYHGQHKAGRDFVKPSVVETLAKDWRSSVVRIPMMYASESGTNGGKGYDQDVANSVKMVDSIVKAAIDYGIYVVVDWHEVNTIGHQDQAVTFFTDIAQRWGSYPNVIYEVFNEPTTSSWSQIKTYSTAVIQAIRQKDPDNLIIVGTRTWSQQVMEAAKDPIKDSDGKLMSNVAYVLHFYASEANHQQLRARADSAMTQGIALFVSEWGNSTASGGGNLNSGYMDSFMNWMLEKKLSWCNWSLSDIPESSAALRNGTWNPQGLITHAVSTNGSWADGDLSQSGLFVRNKLIANRPAYSSLVNVLKPSQKTSQTSSISFTRAGGGIELQLGDSHKWTSAVLFDARGTVVARASLVSGMTSVILTPNQNVNTMVIAQLKNAHGVSETVWVGIIR